MKRICLITAAAAMVLGTVGSAAAVASQQPARDTHPVVSAATRTAKLAKLQAKLSKLERSGKRLSAQQLRSLGLRPASSQDVARAKHLAHNGQARAATIGTPWGSCWQYYGVTWICTGYVGPYYSYPWYPYYYVYNDVYICTTSGTNCGQSDSYFYELLIYYYPTGTWYWYGSTGDYGNNTAFRAFTWPPPLGWGPYTYEEGV